MINLNSYVLVAAYKTVNHEIDKNTINKIIHSYFTVIIGH